MENLEDAEYLRQRLDPRPGDAHYLILSDLALALRSIIPHDVGRVLDFGSGGSPYRSLFGECVYHRADLSGDGIDFRYGPDSLLPETLCDYNLVLSTQVLEHVESPMAYLNECRRVLSPKGRLILSTHGMFEEHGCPYDFWRWTTFGLEKMVEAAGFRIEICKKLTTGPRAALFLVERQFHQLRSRPLGAYAKAMALSIRTVQKLGAHRLHRASDKSHSQNRVVDSQLPGHDMYIAIALCAVRD